MRDEGPTTGAALTTLLKESCVLFLIDMADDFIDRENKPIALNRRRGGVQTKWSRLGLFRNITDSAG